MLTTTDARSPRRVHRAEVFAWNILFVILAVGLQGCQAPFGAGIKGSGVVKSEKRAAAAFQRIEVGSSIVLDWQLGKETSLEVSAEDNLLPHLITEVVGDTLKIRFDVNVNPTKEVTVKASSLALDGLDGSGASRSTLTGVKSDEFTLSLSGASRCTMAGEAKSLTVDCSGASDLKAKQCDAAAATVTTSGASSAELQAKELRSVHLAGASKVNVSQVAADELKIELAGSSRCTLAGQAGKVTIDAAGASVVEADGLKAKNVEAELSGVARVEIEATESISGSASGSSSVLYRGNPAKQSVRTSGASSAHPK